jgi:ATP-dependent RNA helicase HelY
LKKENRKAGFASMPSETDLKRDTRKRRQDEPRKNKGAAGSGSGRKPSGEKAREAKRGRRPAAPGPARRPGGRPGGRDPKLEGILSQIGVPEPKPFQPDPFQKKALHLLKKTDVLVAAPTGSGKTWIAVEAIRECLDAGASAWYACPLKALSNAKFEEFSEIFGTENVGILTGDRKENPSASLLVGTTEILRNQLYDTMSEKIPLPCDLVVLDEAHYLGESERGVVWEETLIYLPAETRLLLLSATIQNTGEIADWLTSIRGKTCSVVTSFERPVILYPLFLYPNDRIGLLSGKKGLSREVEGYLRSLDRRKGKWKGGPHAYDASRIIEPLRRYNLLPAIFFLKSRADCDRAAAKCRPVSRPPEEQAAFEQDLNACLERFPYLKKHRAMPELVESRVASHHAGQLPFWKVLVEQMMLKGYLDAIFATSTVAGGVNFPARTVVLSQSDRFNGKEFQSLSATDLQQMIGRAGRRGKDEVGFALVVPGPYQDPQLIHERLLSPPDPIESQIRINFSMTLNLLQSHRPEDVRVLIDRSLAAYQQSSRQAEDERSEDRNRGKKARRQDVSEELWAEFLRRLDFLKETGFADTEDRLTWEGRYAAQLRLDHPLLVSEAIRSGVFEGITPETLAGMIATFVVEGERRDPPDGILRVQSRDLSHRVNRMKRELKDLMRALKRRGFDTPEIPEWPAVAVYLWAKGISWEGLIRGMGMEEGDLAMMIVRTADHLNQIQGLRGSHPVLSDMAREAVPLILREPVWI